MTYAIQYLETELSEVRRLIARARYEQWFFRDGSMETDHYAYLVRRERYLADKLRGKPEPESLPLFPDAIRAD